MAGRGAGFTDGHPVIAGVGVSCPRGPRVRRSLDSDRAAPHRERPVGSAPNAVTAAPAQDARLRGERVARDVFTGLPARYDRLAYLLSFGQDRRWRRAVVRPDRGRAARAGTRRGHRAGRDRAGHRRPDRRRRGRGRPQRADAAGRPGPDPAARPARPGPGDGRPGRPAPVPGRAASTRSASPTCCATWTTRPRRWPKWPASCAPAAPWPAWSSWCRRSRAGGRPGGCTPGWRCRCSAG